MLSSALTFPITSNPLSKNKIIPRNEKKYANTSQANPNSNSFHKNKRK